jgi:RNA polymerase sigma-70 factor (ECF subfamily)
MLSEELLIEKCRKGEQKAQEELYDRFCATMLGVCMRYCGNRPEAEDLLQEGFMKVFRNIYDFKPRNEGSLATWIKRIMVNTSLNYLREKKHFSFIEEIETVTISEQEKTEVFTEENDQMMPDMNELITMINELPDGYKIIFNLYVFEKQEHKEIARMLGIAEGTSKSQLSKARGYLQKKIKEWENVKKKKIDCPIK